MDIIIPSATSIGLFAVAATLLLLTPGPAVLYIVARGKGTLGSASDRAWA